MSETLLYLAKINCTPWKHMDQELKDFILSQERKGAKVIEVNLYDGRELPEAASPIKHRHDSAYRLPRDWKEARSKGTVVTKKSKRINAKKL